MDQNAASPVTAESSIWERLLKLNPSVVRGVLVAVAVLLAQVLNHTVLTSEVIDAIVNIFSVLGPLVAGLFIRSAVVPNAKVIAYVPDPVNTPQAVLTGEAAPPPDVPLAAGDTVADLTEGTPFGDGDPAAADAEPAVAQEFDDQIVQTDNSGTEPPVPQDEDYEGDPNLTEVNDDEVNK